MVIRSSENKTKRRWKNSGTTLVEVTVTFALLAIFLTCAAVIIGTIANMYYSIKGETYSKQVADIVLEKVVSEIEGAKYTPIPSTATTDEARTIARGNPEFVSDFKSVSLYDRTDTRVKLCADDGELLVGYYSFEVEEDTNKSRVPTTWKFDGNVYNGYSVEELYFVPGNKLSSALAETWASNYGFSSMGIQYGENIVVVFLKLTSPKYDDYYTYRVVKMYNVSESSGTT